jgi:histidine ammonia-lyase
VINTAVVVGIEAMAAAQGIELKRPLKSSALIEAEFDAIRSRVAFLDRDRYLAPDIEAMRLWALHADGRRSPASLVAILPSQLGAF